MVHELVKRGYTESETDNWNRWEWAIKSRMLEVDYLEKQRDQLYISLDHCDSKKGASKIKDALNRVERQIGKHLAGEKRSIEEIEAEYFAKRDR